MSDAPAPTLIQKVAAAYGRLTSTKDASEPLVPTCEDSQLVLASIDNAEIPLHIRVKLVELVGRRVSPTDQALVKKLLQSLVKVVCDNDSPQLHVAVIHALQQLSCHSKPSVQPASDVAATSAPVAADQKIQEHVTRITVDVMVQIVLDKDSFQLPVRNAANAALAEIAQGSFKALITKLLHLLSDDREVDDVAQIAAERKYALESISQLVTTPKYAQSWTEELQRSLLSYATLVFRTVTAQELEQLAKLICELPHVKESHGAHLLEAFLLKATFDNTRSLESLLLITNTLPRTLVFPMLGEKFSELKLISKAAETSGEVAVGLSKALVAASRMATPEVAEKLLLDVMAGLEKLIPAGTGLPSNFTQLESFLLATTILASKRGSALVTKLGDAQFKERLVALKASLTAIVPELTFAVKKKVEQKAANNSDAEAIASVTSVLSIVSTLSERHLPSATIAASWEKKSLQLPTIKRAREETPAETAKAGPAAPAKVEQRQVYRPKGKQEQQQKPQQQQQQQQGRKVEGRKQRR